MPDRISKELMAEMVRGGPAVIAAGCICEEYPRIYMSKPNGSFIYVERPDGHYDRWVPADTLPDALVMQIRLMGFTLGDEHAR